MNYSDRLLVRTYKMAKKSIPSGKNEKKKIGNFNNLRSTMIRMELLTIDTEFISGTGNAIAWVFEFFFFDPLFGNFFSTYIFSILC